MAYPGSCRPCRSFRPRHFRADDVGVRQSKGRSFTEFSLDVLDASAGFVNGFSQVFPGDVPSFGPVGGRKC
jgi:hypothetical protein